MGMLVKTGLILVFLLVKPGSQTLAWSVTYTPSKICAVLHSSVVLPCKCSYPRGEKVSTYVWYHQKQKGAESVVVSVSRFSAVRSQEASAGRDVLDCSFTLNNVTQDSAGIYRFSFSNNISTQDLNNQDGITLQITDLKVDIVSESDVVTVGQWVMLICGTCIPSITVPTYIWHKDEHLYSKILGENLLELLDVSLENEGNYSCSIRGHEGLGSSAVNLIVKSPPKNVSVSVSPSGGIVEGNSVNLTCSSDANPPVEIYTWFKDDGSSPVGFGPSYSFIVNNTTSGQYYCEVHNGHGSLRSALVPVVLNAGHSMILYVALAVGCCAAVAVLVTVVLWLSRRKKQKQNRNTEKRDDQNANPYVEDDTYIALDLSAKSNDDVYHTLELVHPSPPVDSDRAGSSDYENVLISNKVMETSQPCYE